jgi:hypothetical protein
MPWVGFKPTIPVSERAKTVHILDRSATVIGGRRYYRKEYIIPCYKFCYLLKI